MNEHSRFRAASFLLVTIMAAALAGCPDKGRNDRGGSKKDGTGEDSATSIQQTERSWGSFRANLDALESPPEMPTLGTTLGQVTVTPDAGAKLQAQAVTVTIPAGVVDRPLVAKVSEISSGPADPETTKLRTLGKWDISIGHLQVLPKPIQVDVKLDLPADIAGQSGQPHFANRFGARYWDPFFKTWVSLPCVFDPATSTASLVTQHLCLVAVDWNLVTFDEADTDHFRLKFHDSAIRNDAEVCDATFEKRLQQPADQPLLARARADVQRYEVPLYIAYAGLAMEKAYEAYRTAGLNPEPASISINRLERYRREVCFTSILGSSMYNKMTGTMWISIAASWWPHDLRCNTAHELMHAVQARLLRDSMTSQEYRRWWLEAQADYAARHVWGDQVQVKMPYSDPQFLRKPLTLVDDTHEYQANTLIRYMIEKRNLCTFGDLVSGTLSLEVVQGTAEEMLVFGYAADKANSLIAWKSETGYGDMMLEIATFKPLRDFCKSKGVQFADVYRDYAAYMLFDSKCDWLIRDSDPQKSALELRSLLATAHPAETLKLADREALVKLSARTKGTCDHAAIMVEHTPDEIQSGRKKTVEVIIGGMAFSGSDGTTDLYLLTDSHRQTDIQPIPAGKNAAKRQVVVGPKDTLAILVTNTTMTGNRDVEVRVRHLPSVSIEPSAITEHLPNEEIEFEAAAVDIPPEHRSVKFEWAFEDKEDLNHEETVPVDSSGRAKSKLKRTFDEQRDYKLEVRVLAPDTGARLASRACPIHIGPGMPEISFAGDELSIIYGADEFIEARTRRLDPAAVYSYKWTFEGKTRTTALPEFRIRHEQEGRFALQVDLLGPDGQALAQAKTVLNVAKSDAEWVVENHVKYDRTGKAIGQFLGKKYQVRKGTRIKHGLYFEAFLMADCEPEYVGKQWKICSRYDEGKLAWFKKYNLKDKLLHSYQLDSGGKMDGLELKATSRESEDVLVVSRYSHGVIQRKETRLEKNQQVWILELFDAGGEKILQQGYDRENGRLILKMGYRKDKPHGPCQTWHSDGKVKAIGQFDDGKQVGHWKTWRYTGQMHSEEFYDDKGKITRQIRYDNGEPEEELTWDAAGTKTSRKLRPD